MTKKSNSNIIIYAFIAIVILLPIAILLFDSNKTNVEVTPDISDSKVDESFKFDTIDSSSCIACHTNEAIIAASTFGQDKPVAENTGG